MLSIYAKLSSHLLAVKGERVEVNTQGAVLTLARFLKKVSSYHQELISHPMPEHIEVMS